MCYIKLYYIILYCIILYCIILYCIILYYIKYYVYMLNIPQYCLINQGNAPKWGMWNSLLLLVFLIPVDSHYIMVFGRVSWSIFWSIGFFGFVHSSSHWLVYWCEMNVFVAVRAPFKWFLGCWFLKLLGSFSVHKTQKNDPVFDFGMASLIKAYYTSRFKTQLESSSSWFAFQFPLFHWWDHQHSPR